MKKVSLVVMFFVVLSLMLIGCTKQVKPDGSQDFKVEIQSNGKVLSAAFLDGSEFRYSTDEKKRIPGARLAFGTEGSKVLHYLKKENGKWKKEEWKDEISQSDPKGAKEGIIAYVHPDGTIYKVTNLDGSEPSYMEPIDFANARIATKNFCCWRSTPSGGLCLCSYCPWGCI